MEDTCRDTEHAQEATTCRGTVKVEPTTSISTVEADHEEKSGSESVQVLQFTTTVIPEGLSKRQWKKQIRQQRKLLQKDEAKARRKEKMKKKKESRQKEKLLARARAAAAGEPPRKRKIAAAPEPNKKRLKKMSDKTASALKVAIDFGFEDLMSDKDIRKLLKQCQRCYAENRRASAPFQYYWTSFSGRSKERMDTAVPSYKSWDIHKCATSFVDEFGKENVVFLTSESPNILNELDPSKAYVIGGLVDHNHHKGYCYRYAVECGVDHAQLPISDYIEMNCRKVLAVNHVFEILLSFADSGDWKKAFYDVIPQRKLAGEPENEEVVDPIEQCSDHENDSPVHSDPVEIAQ